MTGRERLLAAIRGEVVDRPPIWLREGFNIGGNLLSPHSEGQIRAMRKAYDAAGWRPDDVDLIECHGTGTPVGDTTELHSLRT